MKKSIAYFVFALATSSASAYNVQNNAIHYGVSIEDTSYVRSLLDTHSINLTDLNKNGNAPLHIIAKNNSVKMFYVMYAQMTPQLLEQKNISGETPLISAVKSGNPDIAFLFVESGANPYTKDIRGFDSFYYAEASNSELMIQILNGYNVTKNINEYTLKIDSIKQELKNSQNLSDEDKLVQQDKINYYEGIIANLNMEINNLKNSLPKASEMVDLAPISVNYTVDELDAVRRSLPRK